MSCFLVDLGTPLPHSVPILPFLSLSPWNPPPPLVPVLPFLSLSLSLSLLGPLLLPRVRYRDDVVGTIQYVQESLPAPPTADPALVLSLMCKSPFAFGVLLSPTQLAHGLCCANVGCARLTTPRRANGCACQYLDNLSLHCQSHVAPLSHPARDSCTTYPPHTHTHTPPPPPPPPPCRPPPPAGCFLCCFADFYKENHVSKSQAELEQIVVNHADNVDGLFDKLEAKYKARPQLVPFDHDLNHRDEL